ncbi:hypothetical protein Ddye_030957 [Dipteronia dyeriana]|uniref:Uncharacterized protein n=1 Tax=Dipteronia dyeriana TaxID=168575 RepID=A0AAD9WN80_9ROSI|nr:hypothetical protein Ddye_030957 [Dipteronia dyeriana]
MGRSPCCEKVGLKKGPWTPEEDQKLLAYIEQHGHGSWRALPAKAGLQRCGKSCRLRWINYLRPDIKRGKFSLQEEQTIIQLHALLGNRWSAIATHLPKRTDNEIKNYWNTHLKKRLTKMGIDPVTHKPKTNALGSAIGQTRDAANLSHMAQWESARLEAEARLVRESKVLLVTNPHQEHQLIGSSTTCGGQIPNKATGLVASRPQCLDVLKAWQGVVSGMFGIARDLESPTSTLNFPEKNILAISNLGFNENFVGNNSLQASCFEKSNQMKGLKEKIILDDHEMTTEGGAIWFQESSFRTSAHENIIEGLSEDDVMLICESGDGGGHQHQQQRSSPMNGEDQNSDINNGAYNANFEDNKNYWNSILNLVNASATWSPVF